jgi:ABC-2 type transport system ATP-binding protein
MEFTAGTLKGGRKMIRMQGLTKRFPGNKGIFGLDLEVERGEVFGFLGPNGAGKSTTIRHLMGFMKPDEGEARIGGLDCWRNASEIQRFSGYLPGEIALPEGMSGEGFLRLIAGMRGMKSGGRRDELLQRLQLDPAQPVRKMSKGTRQKLALVAALMHDPEVLILDEPTSGLDPLMQRVFIDLIREEKSRGKTIFMSSHQFPEIERTCDRVGIIKEGRLVAVESVQEMRRKERKAFVVTLGSDGEIPRLEQAGLTIFRENGRTVEIEVQGDLNTMIRALAGVNVLHLETKTLDLEEMFLHYYGEEKGRER